MGYLIFTAFRTGEPKNFNLNYQQDSLDNYFKIAAQRSGNFLVISFTDTADQDRSEVEKALRKSQASEKTARSEIEAHRQQLFDMLNEMPANIATLQGPDHVYEFVSSNYQALFPGQHIIGRPLREVITGKQGKIYLDLLNQVYQTEKSYSGVEIETWLKNPDSGELGKHYFNVFFQPRRNQWGKMIGMLNFANDVTELVRARYQAEESRQQVQRLNQEFAVINQELKEARAYAELQREQLYNIFMQAPAMICILEGPEHIFKLVNPPYQKLVGNRALVGKPIAEAMPELAGQPIFNWLDQVYRTGETFFAHETLVQLDHDNSGGDLGQNYYNFIYQGIRNLAGEIEGILVFAYEVTAQVKSRRQVEYSNQQIQALNEDLEARVAERTQQVKLAQAATERQRQRLERLFMQAPAAICILNGPDLIYELVNPAYQQLFPNRELLNKPILEALPEIEKNPVYHSFLEVYKTGKTHEERGLLIPIVRPEDGTLENRYFNFIQQARYNAKGEINGILVFAFEVTVQVEARKSSEASSHLLRLITDALPVLIGYLDKEEKYRFANRAYKSWFNQEPEALLGKPVREIVGEAAYQGVKQYIQRALAGERLDFEAAMPYRENFKKYIRTSYVPDVQAGEVVGFFTLVTDVTEQVEARRSVEESGNQAKALAQELALANQELTRTNIDLDNFIYTASHDLKAPISNIEGLMEALLDQLPPETKETAPVKRTTDLILDSVERFKRTIDHLTDITKLQKENHFSAKPVNLTAIISDVKLDLAPVIQATQARLEIDIDGCSMVNSTEKNLRSIMYNLLSNALKYHSPDRAPVVQITCSQTSDYQVLSVQDNGLGIDLTQENKLFAMFKRLHSHVEGSGIGLYMVKKIIENAGGKIEVQSKVGEGSEFRVYFRQEF
jgi:two-component system, sensor histidine kinase